MRACRSDLNNGRYGNDFALDDNRADGLRRFDPRNSTPTPDDPPCTGSQPASMILFAPVWPGWRGT